MELIILEALWSFLTVFIIIISFVPLVKFEMKLMELIHKKTKYFQNISLFFVLGFFVPFILLQTIVAAVKYGKKWEKSRESMYNIASNQPTTENIGKLIDFIETYGCENRPECWNMLRGVWFSINENSTVPTDKKTELRNYLMSKGLRLVGNERNIIDNYAKA